MYGDQNLVVALKILYQIKKVEIAKKIYFCNSLNGPKSLVNTSQNLL